MAKKSASAITQAEESIIPDVSARVSMASRAERFEGPLPHPETLAAYERVRQGLGDRLVTAFEQQQAHRHALELAQMEMEQKALVLDEMNLKAKHALEKRGQWFGFTSILAGMCVIATMAAKDAPVPAVYAFTAVLISVTGGFLGKRLIDLKAMLRDKTEPPKSE